MPRARPSRAAHRARPRRHVRGDEEVQPARPRRRRLHHRRSNGRPAATRPGDERYVVCNADEGEPGTFKDRVLLQSFAEPRVRGHGHRRLRDRRATRALSICAANTPICARRSKPSLREMRAERLLGMRHLRRAGLRFRHRDPHGRRRLRLRRGNRADRVARRQAGPAAHPTAVPGRPAAISGQPTVVNNVETLCKVDRDRDPRRRLVCAARHPAIDRHQDDLGVRRLARGPAFTNIRSACSVAQVLEDCGADERHRRADRRRRGLLPRRRTNSAGASPSRTCRPRAPSWCSARAATCSRWRCNFAHFFAHESCGFCTPCRVGTALIARIMDKIDAGHGARYEINELNRLARLHAHVEPLRPRPERDAAPCAT